MKRTLKGMVKSEPLLREALGTIRAHRDAEDGGAPLEEVELLRLLADSLSRGDGFPVGDVFHSLQNSFNAPDEARCPYCPK